MYFLTEDDDLLKKYNKTGDKVSTDTKKEFDSKPVNNFFFFLKTKIKCYDDEATYFLKKRNA